MLKTMLKACFSQSILRATGSSLWRGLCCRHWPARSSRRYGPSVRHSTRRGITRDLGALPPASLRDFFLHRLRQRHSHRVRPCSGRSDAVAFRGRRNGKSSSLQNARVHRNTTGHNHHGWRQSPSRYFSRARSAPTDIYATAALTGSAVSSGVCFLLQVLSLWLHWNLLRMRA